MKGKVVGAVPPVSRARSTIDWDSPALLAKMTGQPVLAATDIRNTRVKAVRQYTRAPFITPEGRIVVELRNSHINPDDGERYGDVYFTWEPTPTTPKESK